MANFLDYDIYDLELTAVKSNTDLRRLFIETTGKSIIVIEDIDCSIDITGKRKNSKKNKKKKKIPLPSSDDEESEEKKAFKVLAKNYLGVEKHELFSEIRQLLEEEAIEMSPADVTENLMPRSKKKDVQVCLGRLLKALHEAKEAKAARNKADSEEEEDDVNDDDSSSSSDDSNSDSKVEDPKDKKKNKASHKAKEAKVDKNKADDNGNDDFSSSNDGFNSNSEEEGQKDNKKNKKTLNTAKEVKATGNKTDVDKHYNNDDDSPNSNDDSDSKVDDRKEKK
uniref:AAA+ ATPase At3g28540-like C-terminal domain-containing protein n=1 Tax=Leersia perrieri TaxID=77586 RepID=A0A0D9X2R7_9ORYZ